MARVISRFLGIDTENFISYVKANNELCYGYNFTGNLVEFDLNTLTRTNLTAAFSGGNYAFSAVPIGNNIFFAPNSATQIARFNITTKVMDLVGPIYAGGFKWRQGVNYLNRYAIWAAAQQLNILVWDDLLQTTTLIPKEAGGEFDACCLQGDFAFLSNNSLTNFVRLNCTNWTVQTFTAPYARATLIPLDNGNLLCFNPAGGNVIIYDVNFNVLDNWGSFPASNFLSWFKSNDGKIYALTGNDDISEFDLVTRTLRRYATTFAPLGILSDNGWCKFDRFITGRNPVQGTGSNLVSVNNFWL